MAALLLWKMKFSKLRGNKNAKRKIYKKFVQVYNLFMAVGVVIPENGKIEDAESFL
jgi:hypothetical protein